MTPGLREALSASLRHAWSDRDPEAVTDDLRALTETLEALSRVRDELVVELVRSGVAQSMVADMLGVSRQRVSQVMARAAGPALGEVLQWSARSQSAKKGARTRAHNKARSADPLPRVRVGGSGLAIGLEDRWR